MTAHFTLFVCAPAWGDEILTEPAAPDNVVTNAGPAMLSPREARGTTKRLAPPNRRKTNAKKVTAATNLPAGISDTSSWSDDRLNSHLVNLKEKLAYEAANPVDRAFWDLFEVGKKDDLASVIRTAEELIVRKATLREFREACTNSKCRGLAANLLFLEFSRLKAADADQVEQNEHLEKAFDPKLFANTPTIRSDLQYGIDIFLKSYTSSAYDMYKALGWLTDLDYWECQRRVKCTPVSLGKCATQDEANAVEQFMAAACGAVINT